MGIKFKDSRTFVLFCLQKIVNYQMEYALAKKFYEFESKCVVFE